MLFFEELGGGSPLLFLHGFLGSGTNWRQISKHFSERYTCILPDLRNHGWSFHNNDCSYLATAEDVCELIRHYHLNECIIIGHSMGGKIAMSVMSMIPEYIKAGIIVDIAPKAYAAIHAPILDAMCNLSLSNVSSLSELDLDLSREIPDPELRRFLLKNLVKDNEKYVWKINLEALRKHSHVISALPPISEGIDIPVLVIKAGNSSYIKDPEDRYLFERYFDQTWFEIIPGAGHWVHASHPREFLACVDHFINES